VCVKIVNARDPDGIAADALFRAVQARRSAANALLAAEAGERVLRTVGPRFEEIGSPVGHDGAPLLGP
jgi:hypothetical protein